MCVSHYHRRRPPVRLWLRLMRLWHRASHTWSSRYVYEATHTHTHTHTSHDRSLAQAHIVSFCASMSARRAGPEVPGRAERVFFVWVHRSQWAQTPRQYRTHGTRSQPSTHTWPPCSSLWTRKPARWVKRKWLLVKGDACRPTFANLSGVWWSCAVCQHGYHTPFCLLEGTSSFVACTRFSAAPIFLC